MFWRWVNGRHEAWSQLCPVSHMNQLRGTSVSKSEYARKSLQNQRRLVIRFCGRVYPSPLTFWCRWVISCAEHGLPFKPLPICAEFCRCNHCTRGWKYVSEPSRQNVLQNLFFILLYKSTFSLSLALSLYWCMLAKEKNLIKSLFRKRHWSSDPLLNFMSWFPFAVMLGAVWNFLASYPLAQHCSFHFVFIAQLVGRDQECASGVACSAGFRSPMNQPNSFTNVSVLCWAYVGVLLESVFHGR